MVMFGLCPVGLTAKVCVNGTAAAKVRLSPGCEAVMVQALTEVTLANVTFAPLTVQTVEEPEVYVTGSPELAVAVRVSVVVVVELDPICVPGFGQVMVCSGSVDRTGMVMDVCVAAK
jgi:hypothetical protein